MSLIAKAMYISIPFSTIKSRAGSIFFGHLHVFQFHLVRLKVRYVGRYYHYKLYFNSI